MGMGWRLLATAVAGLAISAAGSAQTTGQAGAAAAVGPNGATGLVPLGLLADRNALTAMDYIEIQQLYARYAVALDFGDGPARATTFAPGGAFFSPMSKHKPEPVPDLVKRTNEKGSIGDRHMISHLIITPTKEGADGFAYVLKVDRFQKVYTGFYQDKLVKTPDGWRFFHKEEFHENEPESPFKTKYYVPPKDK